MECVKVTPKAYIDRRESLEKLEKKDYETVHGTRVIQCMYCGKEIEWINSNNPDDYIHQTIPSKFSADSLVGTCSSCNRLVTLMNREIYNIISNPESIELHISNLEERVAELKKNKDAYATHYIQQKYQDEHLRYKSEVTSTIYAEYSEEEKKALEEERERLIQESKPTTILDLIKGRGKKNDEKNKD